MYFDNCDELTHLFNCEHPRYVKNSFTGKSVLVPCGKCSSCINRRITKYVPSILNESNLSYCTIFFTLTYSDIYLPKVDLDNYIPNPKYREIYEKLKEQSKDYIDLFEGHCIPVLSVIDAQNFIKRLREIIFREKGKRSTFRYFLHGDYGSTLFRPHWHGLLFIRDKEISDCIGSYIFQAWRLYNSSIRSFEQIGRIDVQFAYGAAQYVSSYVNSDSNRPSIYQFRDFKAKPLHSSTPPFGSIFSSLESIDEIVRKSITQITIYDPKKYSYKKTSLPSSLVRKLFPRIPTFMSLHRNERFEIYRILEPLLSLSPDDRRKSLFKILSLNSFFYDYVTLNAAGLQLTEERIIKKLDVLYYTFKRLYLQSKDFNVSVFEYDQYVYNYFNKLSYLGLKKQLAYEEKQSLSTSYNDALMQSAINNEVLPTSFDSEFFRLQKIKFNKLIKRKCDNAYLEKYPQFKKFHS